MPGFIDFPRAAAARSLPRQSDCLDITWLRSCILMTSLLLKKAFGRADGQSAVADVQNLATGNGFLFDTLQVS
jgi:hypothetical protein